MSYKATHSYKQRVNRAITYKVKKKIKKFFKNDFKKITKEIFKIIFGFLKYIVLFVLLCFLASYDFYYDNKIESWLVIWFYIWFLVIHKSDKINYKSWQEKAKYNEFEKIFCDLWKPPLIGYLFAFWIGLKFCNNFEFILIMFIANCYDLWTRRYLTNDIKQDLILKELEKYNKNNTEKY